MKQVILLSGLLGITTLCFSQSINWSTTKNWKIYTLNNKEAFYYPVDTLGHFQSVPLNDSTVISFLSHSTTWPKGKYATWMGLYIASYETAEKKIHKVVFSSYGGFLFESASRRYFELPVQLREKWNEFILQHLQKVFEP